MSHLRYHSQSAHRLINHSMRNEVYKMYNHVRYQVLESVNRNFELELASTGIEGARTGALRSLIKDEINADQR